ncbi:Uncharacterised protein [uncultured archaeon]|nr:Uncharacterised protein [uncultured archaeon]
MAVGLSVSGDVDQLGLISGEGRDQTVGECLSIFKKLGEGHILGNLAIVDKDGDLPVRFELAKIWMSYIQPGGRILPFLFSDLSISGNLMRCQDNKLHSLLGQDVQADLVHRSFWEPHSFRLPS